MSAWRIPSPGPARDVESEAKWRAIFGLSPIILCITGLEDGRIREVNETFLETTGYTREEILGRTVTDLGFWLDLEQRERGMKSLQAGTPIRGVETRFRMKNGEERVTVLAADVVMVDGQACILAALTDITDRKRAEEALRESREETEALVASLRAADRAKDGFLAMLGHELRNPLGTITNAVAVLDKIGGNDTSRNLVSVIGRQAGHLARLVDDLLDVARLSSGKIELRLEPLDLHELARQSLDARTRLGGARGHSVELLGEAVYAEGDRTRLAQVLDNLVDNAIKYTPPGGRVTVATERSGEAAVLRVRDSGIGMAPELVPRVFDFFTQAPQTLERSHENLGLGLALVKRLVELHGGSVSASSAGVGKGSEFTITLPGASEPTPRAAGPATGVRVSGKHLACRVLVVEDSADARLGLQLLLQQSGHSVETAGDGQDGLAKLRRFRPDVALIDVGLPGMDGYELARMARSQPETRDIRLIAITGYGQAADKRRALDAGFDLHLAKPVDPLALQELLNGIERGG
jgi:PAS domain S-box-containing protein